MYSRLELSVELCGRFSPLKLTEATVAPESGALFSSRLKDILFRITRIVGSVLAHLR